MDLDAIYCPQPEIIQPFALAFTRMMFAHAGFEEEVRQLQGVVTNDPDFGEVRIERCRLVTGAGRRICTNILATHISFRIDTQETQRFNIYSKVEEFGSASKG